MKRSIAAIASLLLVSAATLSACGNESKTAGEAGDGKGSQPVKKDISILTTEGGSQFVAQAPASEKDKYYNELNKLSGYNVKYELMTWGGGADYKQQLALRFATGDLGDLVMTDSIYSNVHAGAVDQNVFLDLGPLLDKYGPNIKKNIPEVAWKSPRVQKNGKIYGIPILSAAPATRIMFMRGDWLKKLNMEPPKTLDEFLKFAEGVKNNDMNGDGKNNEYALALTDNLGWSDVFSGSFGVRPDAWQMRGGKMEPDMIQPQMKEAIAFYKKLYDNGYIAKDFVTRKQGDRLSEIYKGYFGAYGAAANQYGSFTDVSKYVNQPGAETVMITPPKGPRGEAYFEKQSEQIDFVWVVPAKTKNPEEVIKFLDWVWGHPDAEKFFGFGIKDYNYKEENGKVVFDEKNPANAENVASGFFRKTINPRGASRPIIVKYMPEPDNIMKAYDDAAASVYKHASLGMPQMESLDGRPELDIGLQPGSLFYDTFVKLVVGKEDLDTGFDKFVKEWRSRGGDTAIKEATDWYNAYRK
ncbi:extracellular solute-binding protein [Paenibacillus ginsengarvi]|nr:extracellular solute-binding protein [Paenibacillus ginsengarvi]